MSATPGDDIEQDNKLGAAFPNYPLKVEEQKRIASRASEEGPIKRVLTKYVPKTEIYKAFEKSERVDGCRPGSNTHKQKLMVHFIDYWKHPKSKKYSFCWKVYHNDWSPCRAA